MPLIGILDKHLNATLSLKRIGLDALSSQRADTLVQRSFLIYGQDPDVELILPNATLNRTIF